MYELFLTALIQDEDLEAACSVLEGFCGMRPWETVHRVLYFQGPPKPAGMNNQTSIDKRSLRKDTLMLWKDLHQNLNRQSFILQARYDLQNFKAWSGGDASAVNADASVGKDPAATAAPPAASSDLNAIPGILRWTDFPDPPHGRPNITQRKKVELWEQKNLVAIMRDNNHQYVCPFVTLVPCLLSMFMSSC
jgi:mediator of RNA polymerase II transcription subunit 18, fungi type